MMNFGYHTDDVIDGANFFGAELDDYELPSVEDFSDFSDNFEITASDEEATDFDEKGDSLFEDIMKGYEIYNMT